MTDALVVEPVGRDHRDALAAHHADAKLGLAAHHVLVDRRVREARERGVPRDDHGLALIAVDGLQRHIADPLELALAHREAAHETTPTRTSRKRAGAAPWPVWPTWPG